MRPHAERPCLVVAPAGVPAVTDALERAGFTTVAARSEREALGVIEGGDLAAVYVTQSLGGPAVARLVAAGGQRLGDAPVVVLGGSGTVQEAVDAMQLGAADYVAPPYDPAAVVRRLARGAVRARPPRPRRLVARDAEAARVHRQDLPVQEQRPAPRRERHGEGDH